MKQKLLMLSNAFRSIRRSIIDASISDKSCWTLHKDVGCQIVKGIYGTIILNVNLLDRLFDKFEKNTLTI